MGLAKMKAFLCASALFAVAIAAPSNPYHAAPTYGYAGQTSHQSVTKGDGEVRHVQVSKAFGAGHAAVGHAVHTNPIALAPAPYHPAPVVHKVAAPYHPAPVVHKPAPYHPAPVVHKPVAPYHPAPATYKEEPAPYAFEYGVADDYSKAAFNAAETADGSGAVTGSYSVALPDGRTQHVKYTADHYNGYVADVSYEGVPVYPEAKPYHPAKPAPYHA